MPSAWGQQEPGKKHSPQELAPPISAKEGSEDGALLVERGSVLHPMLLVDCEEGQLAVVKVSPALLLGMLADKDMEPGLLRKKIMAMQELLLAQRIDTLFQ